MLYREIMEGGMSKMISIICVILIILIVKISKFYKKYLCPSLNSSPFCLLQLEVSLADSWPASQVCYGHRQYLPGVL